MKKNKYRLLLLLCFNAPVLFSQSWNQITTTGNISARSNASAIYNPTQNKMFVFGGVTANGNSNELWCLDLTSNLWTLVTSPSIQTPAPRFSHICMYDSLMNRMLVWSGQGSALFNDVWAFNFSDSTWVELFPDGNVAAAPLKRYGTATVFDPLNRNIVNFAGFTTSGRFDDTWSFQVDNSSWTERTNSYHPLLRCLTSQSFAAERREMIVFAGQSTGNLNDIWSLNVDTYDWMELTPAQSPPPRHFSSSVYCGNGNVVVFGGNSLNQGNAAGGLNDLWSFNLDARVWDTLPQASLKPLPRYGHAVIYIPSQSKMLVFGGQGTSSLFNETWEYSGLSSLGILNAQNNNTISVFPNPTADILNITLNNLINENVKLRIMNVLGMEILNKQLDAKKNRIDMSEYMDGIYFIEITSPEQRVTKILVKQ